MGCHAYVYFYAMHLLLHVSYTHLLFHGLGCHNDHLGCWVLYLKLIKDCGCIVCDKQLFQMVDYHLVHPIGPI